MSSRQFRVAVAQVAPAFLDLEGSLDRAEQAVAEASSAGASMVVFAEAWLPGYPLWVDAGVPWEDRTSKRCYGRLQRNAVEVPGPAITRLGRIAREHGMFIVMGANERDTRFSRGTLYNSILYIDAGGELLGVHRKLVPTHSERVIWGGGDGSTLHVIDTPLGRIGGLVCWEHWMPLARFAMHAKGEQVHVALWPDTPDIHHVASRSYAFEGRCYVIVAASYLPLSAVTRDVEAYDTLAAMAERAGGETLLDGGSAIIGPDGHWVVEPVRGHETVMVAEIDLDRIAEEQQALDTAGHYNRPDVFRLHIDETRRDPLVRSSTGPASP